jgi:hypothetical protein
MNDDQILPKVRRLIAVAVLPTSSNTAARPIVTEVGEMHFDTTLGKPIWWDGADWVDATGTVV